ncbi:restriction endonuclease subunit S [Lactobacillus johnsonii]|uniref:Restriction endonuclease subunit S n=1 Tax=Lactobacillus johnsonii TaxID=33959 RepID=A0A9X4X8R5_LACJH|nr:restriction endonuclease subunit S [Lactobacillus johnsonii]
MPSLRNWRKKRVTESNDKKVPALRFKGFTDDWEQRKFESLIYPEKIKNKNNLQLPAYSISNKNGFIAQTDQFGKDNTYSKTDKKTNYIVNPGAFAYNPARINVGSIGYQNLATPVLVSSLYEVFKTNSQINDLFLIYWFKTDKFFNQIKKYEEGGVRQYYFLDKLLFSEIIIPKDAREQQKISKILKKLDYLFSLQQRKLEQIKLLKKAMLQKILAETDNPYPKLRFFGFSNTWKKYTVNSLFKISRGYVLSTALTEANKSAHNPYPVYSSQTKNNGLMGYYNKYLYENAITWTTDGANAGTVNYRSGKFYCTNVCGVILSDKVDANQLIAEELNTVSKRYVSYVGNPKLMNNVMANIKIIIPDQYKERQQISQLFSRQDVFKDVYQRKQNVLKILKQFLLQNMFI